MATTAHRHPRHNRRITRAAALLRRHWVLVLIARLVGSLILMTVAHLLKVSTSGVL